MFAERNPYDPVQIQLPSFWQLMKAGAAVTLGGMSVMGIGAVLYIIVTLMMIGGIGALLSH